MHPAVVALLVSHDGARWLPAVIEGLRSQTMPVSGVVAVDTGSRDESPDLLLDAFDEVVTLDRPRGVPRGGPHRPGAGRRPRTRSGSGCSTTTATRPRTPSSGCWPSRLAATAPTTAPTSSAPSCASGPRSSACSRSASPSPAPAAARPGSSPVSTTRASTTSVRAVLAVNTAGMLVRRRVLDDLGGFDDNLPIFGNDVDFGWRAAARGHPHRRGARTRSSSTPRPPTAARGVRR